MKKGGIGGANTKTGATHEEKMDIRYVFEHTVGYSLIVEPRKIGTTVLCKGTPVAKLFRKNELYAFLKTQGIDWKNYLSGKLLPDDALLVIVRDTLFVIEVKFQAVQGSTDEKLQTCDFKRKQYTKLVADLGWRVEFMYVLNDWFKQPKYKDVLEYVRAMNCHYVFETVPLSWFGLPCEHTDAQR